MHLDLTLSSLTGNMTSKSNNEHTHTQQKIKSQKSMSSSNHGGGRRCIPSNETLLNYFLWHERRTYLHDNGYVCDVLRIQMDLDLQPLSRCRSHLMGFITVSCPHASCGDTSALHEPAERNRGIKWARHHPGRLLIVAGAEGVIGPKSVALWKTKPLAVLAAVFTCRASKMKTNLKHKTFHRRVTPTFVSE